MTKQHPFADLLNLMAQFPVISNAATTKRQGLVGVDSWLKAGQGKENATLKEMHICLLSGAYKAAEKLDNAHEMQAVVEVAATGSTASSVESILHFITAAGQGKSAVNQYCKMHGIGLRVLELAPTHPHAVGAHWSEAACMAAVAFGMEATAAGGDLLCLGSYSLQDEYFAVNFLETLNNLQYDKVDIESEASKNILEILRQHGGPDMAAAVGALLAARSRQLPVLIEGWAGLCAYGLLQKISPELVSHVHLACVHTPEQKKWADTLKVQPVIGVLAGLDAGCGLALAAGLFVATLKA